MPNIIKRLLIALCVLILLIGISSAVETDAGALVVPEIPTVVDHGKLSTALYARYVANTANGMALQAQETVQIVVECDDVQTLLKSIPSLVVESSQAHFVQAQVAITDLQTLACLDGVAYVREPMTPLSSAIYYEGTYLIGATVWQDAGYTGAGTRIAIIDTGYEGYADLLGDELPASVELLNYRADGSDTTGGPHGTAMAEVVHDIAPNAELVLVSISTEVEYLEALQGLAAEDVDMVVCGLGWLLSGAGDGTGFIDEAVDAAIQTNGWLWIQPAGNQAQRHWLGDWADADADGWLDWNGEAYNAVYVNGGDTLRLGLVWEDAWGAAQSDFELVVTDSSGELVAWTDSPAASTGDPTRYLKIEGLTAGEYRIYIFRRDGGYDTPTLQLYGYDHDLDVVVASQSLMEPADLDSVLAVGAVSITSETTVETYSSRGPTTDNRYKPDMVSYDRVSTVSLGERAFSGSSAASAHVAGAAALLWEAHPNWTNEQLYDALLALCVDIDTPGLDNASGHGRLQLSEEADPTPVATVAVTPTSTLMATSTPQPTSTPTMTPVPDALSSTWYRIGLDDKIVRTLVTTGGSTSELWAATNSGVYYSANSASTWQLDIAGLADTNVYRLETGTLNDTAVLYAMTASTVWRKSEGYWQEIPLRSAALSMLTTFGTDGGTNLYAVASNPCSSIFISSNSGSDWLQFSTQNLCGSYYAAGRILVNDDTLYLSRGASYASVLVSTNNGINWNSLATPSAGVVDMSLSSDGMLYASLSGRGVWRLNTSGGSWQSRSIGLPGDGIGTNITAVTVHPTQPETVYAAVSDGRVYRSKDGGASWELFGEGFPPDLTVNALVVLPSFPTRLWAATSDGLWALDGAVDICLPLILKNRYLPPVYASPTATPIGCYDTVANGGFETTSIWYTTNAAYTRDDSFEGLWSMRVGPEPPLTNSSGESYVQQALILPDDASSIQLRFWWQRFGQDKGDHYAVRLYNSSWELLDELIVTSGKAPYWEQETADLTEWAGQQVYLRFAVVNDGNEDAAWFRLDEVAVQVCMD